jgi:hypothetical protein
MIDPGRGAGPEKELLAACFLADGAARGCATGICARYEVRLDCLALALRTADLDGTWKGLSTFERPRFVVRDPVTPPTRAEVWVQSLRCS